MSEFSKMNLKLKCATKNCPNMRDPDGPNKNGNFFCFPSQIDRRNKWLENCRIVPKRKTFIQRICGDHFEDSQFTHAEKTRLNFNAIPTLFTWEPIHPAIKASPFAPTRVKPPLSRVVPKSGSTKLIKDNDVKVTPTPPHKPTRLVPTSGTKKLLKDDDVKVTLMPPHKPTRLVPTSGTTKLRKDDDVARMTKRSKSYQKPVVSNAEAEMIADSLMLELLGPSPLGDSNEIACGSTDIFGDSSDDDSGTSEEGIIISESEDENDDVKVMGASNEKGGVKNNLQTKSSSSGIGRSINTGDQFNDAEDNSKIYDFNIDVSKKKQNVYDFFDIGDSKKKQNVYDFDNDDSYKKQNVAKHEGFTNTNTRKNGSIKSMSTDSRHISKIGNEVINITRCDESDISTTKSNKTGKLKLGRIRGQVERDRDYFSTLDNDTGYKNPVLDNPTGYKNPLFNNPALYKNPVLDNPTGYKNPLFNNPALYKNPGLDNTAAYKNPSLNNSTVYKNPLRNMGIADTTTQIVPDSSQSWRTDRTMLPPTIVDPTQSKPRGKYNTVRVYPKNDIIKDNVKMKNMQKKIMEAETYVPFVSTNIGSLKTGKNSTGDVSSKVIYQSDALDSRIVTVGVTAPVKESVKTDTQPKKDYSSKGKKFDFDCPQCKFKTNDTVQFLKHFDSHVYDDSKSDNGNGDNTDNDADNNEADNDDNSNNEVIEVDNAKDSDHDSETGNEEKIIDKILNENGSDDDVTKREVNDWTSVEDSDESEIIISDSDSEKRYKDDDDIYADIASIKTESETTTTCGRRVTKPDYSMFIIQKDDGDKSTKKKKSPKSKNKSVKRKSDADTSYKPHISKKAKSVKQYKTTTNSSENPTKASKQDKTATNSIGSPTKQVKTTTNSIENPMKQDKTMIKSIETPIKSKFEEPGILPCPNTSCGFIAEYTSDLDKHTKVCTKNPPKKLYTLYACTFCNFVANDELNLQKHRVSFTNDYYFCTEIGCHYFTRIANELREHDRIKHDKKTQFRQAGIVPFMCHVCGVKFQSNKDKRQHIMVDHEDLMIGGRTECIVVGPKPRYGMVPN